MPKYIYVIDDYIVSDDAKDSVHSKIAVSSNTSAFKVIQKIISENPDIEWMFDFDRCNNSRIVTLVAQDVFEFDADRLADSTFKHGVRTISIEQIWMKD